MSDNWYWLIPAFLLIATLYSSVGFGGGSSYLALLVLFTTDIPLVRSTALLSNLVVVSTGAYGYWRAGHLHLRRCVPFVLASVPLAYLGASFRLSEQTFYVILGGVLIVSALLLTVQSIGLSHPDQRRRYPPPLAWLLGGSIGLLSGLVGIGGGIFLSPVLHHLRWEAPLRIAALASFFILVNSWAGLAGLAASDNLRVLWLPVLTLLGAVAVGGQIGTRLSLRKFSGGRIRQVTALLVMIVGMRVLLVNGLQISLL